MCYYEEAEWWAVRRGAYGELVSCDPCDSREEAELFIQEELNGDGVIMSRHELEKLTLDNEEEHEWDVSDDDTVYDESEGCI